jgi:hypothetical protein
MHSHAVVRVISTVPKDVKINPIEAEVIGADYLFAILNELPQQEQNSWRRRLNEYAGYGQLVLRTILITGEDYLNHISNMEDWKGQKMSKRYIEAFRNTPTFGPNTKIWMVELSMPELFASNMRKVGEVLLFAQQDLEQGRDFSSFLIARVPGFFVIHRGEGSSTFSWVPSQIDSHVPVYSEQNISDVTV